jgi:flagellar biogenesis protein FliO
MNSLQFRESSSIADWQLMLLALICLILIMLWYLVKRYAAVRQPGIAGSQAVSTRHRLAAGQVLHQIQFQGKEYLVLESRFGMTPLDKKDVVVES